MPPPTHRRSPETVNYNQKLNFVLLSSLCSNSMSQIAALKAVKSTIVRVQTSATKSIKIQKNGSETKTMQIRSP